MILLKAPLCYLCFGLGYLCGWMISISDFLMQHLMGWSVEFQDNKFNWWNGPWKLMPRCTCGMCDPSDKEENESN